MPRTQELERTYFVRKFGSATPTMPLNEIKRAYFLSVLGGGHTQERVDTLEKYWLQSIVTAAGATPQENTSELWKQAVSSLSLTPTPRVQENKQLFFLHAS